MNLKLRYVHEDRDRHGNVRVYFQRPGGRKTRMREALGSPEFMTRYAALLENDKEIAPTIPGPRKPKPGTFWWLCVQHFASTEHQQLEPHTRRARRALLEACCEEPVRPGAAELYRDFPLDRMTPKALRVLRDRKLAPGDDGDASLPGAARNRVKALRRLFTWALAEDLIETNLARDLTRPAKTGPGWHTWTEAEVEQYRARHMSGSKARLALELMIYTGARRSDVIGLGRQHMRDGWLTFVPKKGSRSANPVTVSIPVLPALATELEAGAAGELLFLLTEYGRPFTHAGFGAKVRQWCNDAGLPHCTAHGLRKTAATLAAENGATPHQLMAIFGWTSLAQASLYTRAAERRRLSSDALSLLEPRKAK